MYHYPRSVVTIGDTFASINWSWYYHVHAVALSLSLLFLANLPFTIVHRIRIRAILCHIYHHALHDFWTQARDLMMMTHLQENIQYADVSTQVCSWGCGG